MKKRILSMLLAIVMVVGLVPGFSITASAATTTVTATYELTHTHSFGYTATNGVITETCKDCTHNATATITIPNNADLYFTGNPITPAEVTYSSNWQGDELTVNYEDNVYRGSAKAFITKNEVKAEKQFTINYYGSTATLSCNRNEAGWANSATLIAPDGHTVSLTNAGEYSNSISLPDAQSYRTIEYFIKTNEGKTYKLYVSYEKVDSIAPTVKDTTVTDVTQNGATVTITASNRQQGSINPSDVVNYTLYLGSTTYLSSTTGVFEITGLTANQTYTFAYSIMDDAGNVYNSTPNNAIQFTTSGVPAPSVPTSLAVTDTTITLNEQAGCEYSLDGENWQSSNVFSGLNRDTVYTFYARYAAADGLPASEKSAGTAIKTVKTEITTASVRIDKPVKNGTPDTTAEVNADAPYIVSAVTWNCIGNFLGGTQYTATFTLTANDGYAFADSTAVTVSDAEQVNKSGNADSLTVTAVFPATDVRAITGIDSISTPPTKTAYTYGDTFAADGMMITVKYDDNTTGTVNYADNRTLFVFDESIVTDESIGVKYKDESGYIPINLIVNPKPITITANRQYIAYGGSIISAVDKVTVDGLVNGDTLAAITLTASTTAVTTNGTITPKDAVICNASDDVVTDCYAITYENGLLTIGLVLDRIEVTAQPKLNYTEGDTLDLSDMVVTAHYTDGSSAQLAYTDVAAIPAHGTMLTASKDGAVIIVTCNGKTAQTAAITVQQMQSGFDYDMWYRTLMMLYNQQFDITATATDGGTITPAGVAKVKYDKNITYTITPDNGYMITDVIVDGKSIGTVSEYTFKRVKDDHTITAIFAEIPWENPYSDVSENDWFYEDVAFVSENNLMIGIVENEIFAPDMTATRAMIVTILWRLEGEPVVNYLMQFEDVVQDEWYSEAVRWAAANGIVLGYDDGLFRPEKAITREQLAAILHRYAAYKGMDNGVIFPMIPQYNYSLWAENDILWADMVGLTEDIGADLYDMTAYANRAEIAAYLRRFRERIF